MDCGFHHVTQLYSFHLSAAVSVIEKLLKQGWGVVSQIQYFSVNYKKKYLWYQNALFHQVCINNSRVQLVYTY